MSADSNEVNDWQGAPARNRGTCGHLPAEARRRRAGIKRRRVVVFLVRFALGQLTSVVLASLITVWFSIEMPTPPRKVLGNGNIYMVQVVIEQPGNNSVVEVRVHSVNSVPRGH